MQSKWIAVWMLAACLAACLAAACSRQESGWRSAADADSVAAYEAYLRDFPAGPQADEARQRLRELQDEAAWANVERAQPPESWQRYLGDWPDGRHADTARERLAAFVPDRPPEVHEAWAVQLGAYSSEAAARKDRQRLAGERADDFSGIPLQVLAPDGIETDVWRLRTDPLPEARARDLCQRLRERSVDCVPVAD